MTCIMDRKTCPPWGLAGGGSAQHDQVEVTTDARSALHMKGMRVPVPAGSLVSVQTGGGGGWGDPLDRDPVQVFEDVVDGYVGTEAARDDYGVVLKDGRIDAAASSEL